MQFQSTIKLAINALIWPFYDHFTQLYNGCFLPPVKMYRNQVCPVLSEAFLTVIFRLVFICPGFTITPIIKSYIFEQKGLCNDGI